jgi:hypothetical protein
VLRGDDVREAPEPHFDEAAEDFLCPLVGRLSVRAGVGEGSVLQSGKRVHGGGVPLIICPV